MQTNPLPDYAMAHTVVDYYAVKKGAHHVISKLHSFQAAKSILYGAGVLSYDDYGTFEQETFPKAWKETAKGAKQITKKQFYALLKACGYDMSKAPPL